MEKIAPRIAFTGTGSDAPREGLDFEPRNAVVAVVLNPSGTKLLVLKKKAGGATFVTGGIEPGQTAEEAARAEVAEETGYINLELVARLPGYRALFYHELKGVNRHALFNCFLFRLIDETCLAVAGAELAIHTSSWVTLNKAGEIGLPEGNLYLLGAAVACHDRQV